MPPSATSSTFQIGTYNPLADTFTQLLDLNDGATFAITNGGLKLPQPEKAIIESGNIRTAGVVVPRWQYKARHIQVEITLRGASVAAILASVRALLSAVETPPYCIRLALPSSSQYSYADVLAVKHDIPNDPQVLLAKAINKIHLDFECRVGLRGDRITLSNLVTNPGFEQPSGPGVQVFNDPFANVNAYSVVSGGAPTLAANVLTLAANSTVTFGSPEWGAVQTWQIRFQFLTGMTANFYLHYTNASNGLYAEALGASLSLNQLVAGVNHQLANVTPTLTNGTWYWLVVTQYPAAPGEVADVQATLYADSAGNIGAAVPSGAAGPVPTFDAVTALSGKMAIQSGGTTLPVGGPRVVNPTQYVALFGPGGWSFTPSAGAATGQCSGAWTGAGLSSANTYLGGPVSSFGAARIDLPPAGTVIANWSSYAGGAPLGTTAIPATAGQIVRASLAAKSSGLHATNAGVSLLINEFDASGAFLRQDTVQSVAGSVTNAGWTTLSGSVTLGANCAYVALLGQIADTVVAGESANGTVWFDNAQCWNQTTTGATTMPYCELRGARSPAQLVVSGLLGDMPAPAFLAAGTFVSSWPTNGVMQLYVGRKQQTSPQAQLAGGSFGAFAAAYSPQATATLDSAAYGGYINSATVGTGGWNPRFTSPTAADAPGVYHVLARIKTAQIVGNLPNLTLRAAIAQQQNPWFNLPSGADIVGQWNGPYTTPLSASNTWTIADAGQVLLPPFPQGALTNPAALYLTPRAQWQDTSASGAVGNTDWQALLPVDGSLLLATLNNPSNSAGAVTNSWLWTYADGLLLNRAAPGDAAAWTISVETAPTPNPAAGAGGPGTSSSGNLNVNSAGDPFLTLDPDQAGANNISGVNQLVAIIADQAGAVYPLHAEIQYSPLFLYPR